MAALPENDRITGPFIASAGQTDFPADFPLIDAPGDRPGTSVMFQRDRAGVLTDLTVTSFSVVDVTESGFTLRLDSPAETGDRCHIVGQQRQKRLRAHPPGGAVRTVTLEDDARELTSRLQELNREARRALKAPFGEAAPVLPPAARRAGRFMAFDDAGNVRLDVRPEDFDVFNKANDDLSNVLGQVLGEKPIQLDSSTVPLRLIDLLGFNRHPEHYSVIAGPMSAAAALVNTARLKAALETGRIIDGGGRTYYINGELRPVTNFDTFRNATLVQTGPVTMEKTFLLDGLSGWTLDTITVDLQGLQQTGGLNQCYGVQVSACTDFVARNITVRNGGAITGILFTGCSDAIIDRPRVKDLVGQFAVEPVDDVMQGIGIVSCSRMRVIGLDVRRIRANWPGRPVKSRHYSRGLVGGDLTDVHFDFPFASEVEQAFDFTGQPPNTRSSINLACATDCSTWGIKLANRAYGMDVNGGTFYRIGRGAVTVGGAFNSDLPFAGDIFIKNVTAYETGGGNCPWIEKRYSFQIGPQPGGPVGFPDNVVFSNCHSIDRQAVPTTDYGFHNTVPPREPDNPIGTVRTVDCSSRGHILGEQFGFHFPHVRVVGMGAQTIPSGVQANIQLTLTDYDPSNLHDVALDSTRLYAKESGSYLVHGSAEFAPNGVGTRELFIGLNGISQVGRSTFANNSGPDLPTYVYLNQPVNLAKGDYIQLAARQTSGGDLGIDRTSSFFSMILLSRMF